MDVFPDYIDKMIARCISLVPLYVMFKIGFITRQSLYRSLQVPATEAPNTIKVGISTIYSAVFMSMQTILYP